jgi:hypothetical protein
MTPANVADGPTGVELMKGEADGLEVLADSAYGSGAVRAALKDRDRCPVIDPLSVTVSDRPRSLPECR